jgi:succinate-semialdehyde dehydrogenase/glutarate-semialdehyde dehydrogenase
MEAEDSATIQVVNPATGQIICHIPSLTLGQVRTAIDAARLAQAGWRALTGKTRAELLRRLFDLTMRNHDDLSIIWTPEQGKPLNDSRAEVVAQQ